MPKAWVVPDNVDTDVIIPARYLTTADPVELGAHCLEDLDPTFASAVELGDVVMAGTNFGCGSSREHAPLALKGAGVSVVIARSFARIFFRNAINTGLAVTVSPSAVEGADQGDDIQVDLAENVVRNRTKGTTHDAEPLPPFLLDIVAAGGLVPWVAHRQASGGKS
ncbi:MAG TPA: 3-isopropylmalate dehydratase small subunit [Actinomycetota bacterium]|nr:3-isopropylmalate dehydratase small subunit [Actinomycetota bacterium]